MIDKPPNFEKIVTELLQEPCAAIFPSDIPQELYHYTNMEAAKNILEDNRLRFSHAHYMNDKNEIKQGLEIIWKIANEIQINLNENKDHDIANLIFCLACTLIITLEKPEERDIFLQKIEQNYPNKSAQIKIFKNYKPRDIFLSCFSEDSAKDSLPMWYMYADQARGVSLCFDGKALIEEHNNKYDLSYPFFSKIIYKKSKYIEVVKNCLCKVVDFVRNEKTEKDSLKHLSQAKEINNDFFSSLVISFIPIAVSYKSRHFKHEKEWRLILHFERDNSTANKQFIVKNGILRPVFFMDYQTSNKNKINKLRLGAGNPNTTDSIKSYLISMGCKARVATSSIPYRNT